MYAGRHKACPWLGTEGSGGDGAYGSGRGGRGLALAEIEGVRGQAQGLPLPEIWVGAEETARRVYAGEWEGRQAEGWP